LKGKIFNEKEAIAYYQRARPRYSTVEDEAPKYQKDVYDALYAQVAAGGRQVKPEEENVLKQVSIQQAVQLAKLTVAGKLAASYWLGLIQYDAKEYDAALDYLGIRTLQFGAEHVFWATGAYYNIARTWEASGQRKKAIEAYETNLLLRNDNGNLVRARWLRELDGGQTKKPAEMKTEAKKPEEKKKEDNKLEEKRTDTKKPEETKTKAQQLEDTKIGEKKIEDKKPEEKKTEAKKP
jgi:tetratricopeptide (TPR) repeat protein